MRCRDKRWAWPACDNPCMMTWKCLFLAFVVGCSGGASTSDGSMDTPSDGVVDAFVDAAPDAVRDAGVQLSKMTYVKPSNRGGQFAPVAISGDGNTFVVGASAEASAAMGINGNQQDTSTPFTGAAYVFVRSGSSWVQQAYLKSSSSVTGKRFGWTVSISGDGNTIAVASIFESSVAGDSGAVYVFTRTGSAWTEQAMLKASNPETYDGFANSLALSTDGQTLIVGANGEDSASNMINGDQSDNSAPHAGAAYVFVRNANVWTIQAYLKASNARAAAGFGRSVATAGNGNVVVVGSQGESSAATGVDGAQTFSGGAQASGAAYVFTRTNTTWAQTAYIKASNTRASTHFGWAVALSSDATTLAVGAPQEASAASGIDGDQSSVTAPSSGAVYVFARSGGTWVQQAYAKASNPDTGDFFAEAIALSADGSRLIVGAAEEDGGSSALNGNQQDNSVDGSGAAYVFGRSGSTWTQLVYAKAINPGNSDSFGSSPDGHDIAVSGDGSLFAIGAMFETGSGTGVGSVPDDLGPGSGAVYLLE